MRHVATLSKRMNDEHEQRDKRRARQRKTETEGKKITAGIHRIDTISAYILYGFVKIDCQSENSYRPV